MTFKERGKIILEEVKKLKADRNGRKEEIIAERLEELNYEI